MNDLLHIPLAFGGLALFVLDQYDRATVKHKELFKWRVFWSNNWSGILKNLICIFMMGLVAHWTEWEPTIEFSISVGYMGSALFKNKRLKLGTYAGKKE